MNVEDVKTAVALIHKASDDDEVAHSMEDDLHQAVLFAIATHTCENPRLCAEEALRTKKISFSRWCA